MKKKFIILIVAISTLLISIILGFFLNKTYSAYKNASYNFSLDYPSKWYVNDLKDDVVTSPGTYFSPEKIDFRDPNYQAPKGFVRITVFNTNYMFHERTTKYALATYPDAKQLLDAMQKEVESEKNKSKLPYTGSVSNYKGLPKKQFTNGAISVESVEALGDHDFMYWVVKNEKLYEFLVSYPVSINDFAEFDKYVDIMTSTFKISN